MPKSRAGKSQNGRAEPPGDGRKTRIRSRHANVKAAAGEESAGAEQSRDISPVQADAAIPETNATSAAESIMEKQVRVVAVGASAGGLESLEQFFDNMPADSGFAFVIIQHLSPDFRSMMDQLLARHSSMTIQRAADGILIEPNVVYLNTPRTELTIAGGFLRARDSSDTEAPTLPIDIFFRSLAEEQKENAIGIIMSGTGSDGTRGAAALREAGGTVIAQEPSSAKFDAMPRSVVERGVANATAVPAAMPELIQRLIRGEELLKRDQANTQGGEDPEREIIKLLHRRYGTDFGYYKSATVNRRIRRRALLTHMHSMREYLEILRTDADGLDTLYHDLLIGVTAFFRDAEAFASLARNILPELLADMSPQRQIRVWVPGCASGEEPVSIAILISEYARQNRLPLNVKIFATDIHFASLEIAGAGLYPESITKNLSPDLVATYFDQIGDKYRVKQNIRRLIVFSQHNLIKDPPFTRMDLVSCRNLLIYFDDLAQKKVVAFFHFALRKNGALMLGPSETTGDIADEFETIDKRWRIYRKVRDVRLRDSTIMLPMSPDQLMSDHSTASLSEARPSWASSQQPAAIQRQAIVRAYDSMLDRYAPPSLLIDKNSEVIHIFGDASRYLLISAGQFNRKINELLRKDLRLAVGAAVERMQAQRTTNSQSGVILHIKDSAGTDIEIGLEKLYSEGFGADFILITFKEKQEKPTLLDPSENSSSVVENVDHAFLVRRVEELDRDLKSTEDSLQSTIEELETSNEELQATNEELMASNEELQSTNEELHSVNEELYTVSAEHQRKIEELTELTADMENLLRSTDIGTVFLDADLRIRRFTPAAARTFNLLPHDIGRPIQHITYQFSYETLNEDIRTAKATRTISEHEIEVGGRSFLLRILPYQSDIAEMEGVVLTIFDVHELRTVRDELAKERNRFRTLYKRTPVMMHSLRLSDATFVEVNDYWLEVMGYRQEEILGRQLTDFLTPASRQAAEAIILPRLREYRHDWNVPYVFVRKDGSILDVRLTSIVDQRGDENDHSFTWVIDVTDRLKAERELEARNVELARINENLQQFTHIVSHDLTGPLRAIQHTTDWIAEELGPTISDAISAHLGRLKGQVAHLGSVLSDLLDYSRAGSTERELECVQLKPELTNIFEVIDNPHALTFSVESAVEDLLAYRVPLLLVFRNLIENSAKYNDRSGGKIIVRCDDGGDHWIFSIEDDGPGIEPRLHDKIFLPFRKLQRKDTVPGNGMGLAIVKKAVEANGGELAVFSDPRQRPGTTFRFTWPKQHLKSATLG
jgi:two-component system CheB/CheR fusion protein